jgi:hypothetical protein
MSVTAYHGTRQSFEKLEKGWFVDDEMQAWVYAMNDRGDGRPKVYKVRLDFENLHPFTDDELDELGWGAKEEEIFSRLFGEGYDALTFPDAEIGEDYIVKDPAKQVEVLEVITEVPPPWDEEVRREFGE